ncbi:hypothetical protein AVEN_178718-1, partial [Araneus ventricosus]
MLYERRCGVEWCRKIRDGRTDVRDDDGQGRKSVTCEDLVQRVDQAVRERGGGYFHPFREMNT